MELTKTAGLAGFVDENGILIGTMDYELNNSYSLRDLMSEKSRKVSPIQKPEKLIALYKDWGFQAADIKQIRKYIEAFVDSAGVTIIDSLFYNQELNYYVGNDWSYGYPARARYEESHAHSVQCFKELMQCVAEQNGFDEIIRLKPLDEDIFSTICWQYKRKEITRERAVSFLEYFLSCRVKGMKTLDEKDKEVLLLEGEIERLKNEIVELEVEVDRLKCEGTRYGMSVGELVYDQMKRSRLDYIAKYAPERVDEVKARIKEEEKENEEKIKQNEEEIKQIQEQIEQIIKENDDMYASAMQLLLYGTRDIEQEIRKLEKID